MKDSSKRLKIANLAKQIYAKSVVANIYTSPNEMAKASIKAAKEFYDVLLSDDMQDYINEN